MMSLFGKDVAQNYEEAFKWFEKVANHGSSHAQKILGTIYFEG